MNHKVLRLALAEKGIPQIALAKLIGVDHGTFSRWKCGWYPVPQRHRKQLAKILDVSEADLFSETENSKKIGGAT